MDVEEALRRILPQLASAGVSPEGTASFVRMYRAYRLGETGIVPWREVEPPQTGDLPRREDLEAGGWAAPGRRQLGRVAWIVLNGGLGTTMRMDRAKSLVAVKGTLSFLDLLARHVLDRRRDWGCALPLLFMNSFATRADTLAALAAYPLAVPDGEGRPLPLDFVQHRFPRLQESDGLPFGDASDPAAWAPPGHGDLYASLQVSGLLGRLLRRGIRWVFVSNADNLGASLDPAILGWMAEKGYEFLMEVTPKTAADRKGGTLVRRRGRLELVELVQVPEEGRADFEDTDRFGVFNTNNLWVDLEALARRSGGGGLALPLIVNRKTVGGVPVVQLESAMGAAISTFDRTAGVLVSRRRFAPVKSVEDLVVRRSDAYVEGREAPLLPNPRRLPEWGPLVVRLDPRFFGAVEDLDVRMPDPLSLVEARTLEVRGDVRFGRGVTVRGDARVDNESAAPLLVPDGAVLGG